jgi:MFS family permease
LIAGLAFGSAIVYPPLFFEAVRGISATQAGLLLAPFAVTSGLCTIVAGQITDRRGGHVVVPFVGMVVSGIGMIMLSTIEATTSAAFVVGSAMLVGVGIGIALKFAIHALNGVPLHSFFKPFLQVTTLDDQTVQINAAGSAVFSNWLPFRRQIVQLGLVQGNDVVVNLAGTRLVDSNVMEKLEELGAEFSRSGLRLDVVGLEEHRAFSGHPYAARRRTMAPETRE